MRFSVGKFRRTAIIGLAVVIGGSLLWCAAWLAIAYRLEGGIEGWVAQRRAEGWKASHGPVALGGFPHRWRARIERPHLVRPRGEQGGFSWDGPWIELGWEPWPPRAVTLRAAGAHALGLEGAAAGRYRVAAAEIAGALRFDAKGALTRLDLGGDALTVTPPGAAAIRANRAILHADLYPDASPQAGTPPPSLALDADIRGVILPENARSALGRTIGRISGEARLMGALPATRPAEALTLWRDQGGVVEIARFSLGWGALTANGAGTVALDVALQPIGALTARVAGYGETIDRLAAAGEIAPNQALIARLALGALARTPEGGGRPEVEVPVSLQDRTLTIGPIPLLRLPIIVWQ